MIEKIILKKSAVLDKMPAAEQLDFGELAINYNAEHPFLSFKDSDGNITALNDYADAIKKKLNISDFNTFKEYITNGIEAFGMNMVEALKTKADKTELNAYAKLSDTEQTILANKLKADDLILKGFSLNGLIDVMNNNINRNTSYIGNLDLQKVDKSDITQSTGTSETAVMSQKAVSDALSNVYTKAESDARYLRGEFEYCGLMEWDGKNEVKIYEMKFDSPKREVFIFAQCTYDKTNKGDFKIIITNETQPFNNYGISYYNSSSYAEENFHIHNVCGNYVCDIINSNNHVVSSALKRCYMRNLLTDKNHEDVGLITNLKIEITKDLVRIDGVQKWYVFAKK